MQRRQKPKASRRSLTDEEQAIVVKALDSLVDLYGTQLEVANRIGIDQPAVSSLLAGRWSAGMSVARAIADHYGIALCELLRWHEVKGYDAADPFANRKKAISAGVQLGISARAVSSLRRLTPTDDLPAVEWMARLLEYEKIGAFDVTKIDPPAKKTGRVTRA